MKRLVFATILALTAGLATPAFAQTSTSTKSLSIPVTGSGEGTLVGTFDLKRFTVQDGVVYATGTLTGVVTTATGVVGSVVTNIAMPVTVDQTQTRECQILYLDLGPLNLDLLGLDIDLSRVVLDITAEAGAGKLLGNLLCAVVNLLNDPSGLSQLLNNILAILG